MSVKVLLTGCNDSEILAINSDKNTPLNSMKPIRSTLPSSASPSPSSSPSPLLSSDEAGEAFPTKSTAKGAPIEDSNFPRRGIYLLPFETIVGVMCFLRATDLCSCAETSKIVFSGDRISRTIELSLSMYSLPNTSGRNSPSTTNSNGTISFSSPIGRHGHMGVEPVSGSCLLRPRDLYIRENKAIMAAVNAQGSPSGYYVSNSWLANAKKYYEAVRLPEDTSINRKSTPSKKLVKIRLRRGSDALPPWPSINADITCSHGKLALPSGPRAKRKIIDKKHWKLLRKFYPDGCEFKTKKTVTCTECERDHHHKKLEEECKRKNILEERSIDTTSPLYSVFARKNGIPSSHLRHTGDELAALHTSSALNSSLDIFHSRDEWSCTACTILNPNTESVCYMCSTIREGSFDSSPFNVSTMPLRPGMYNLVPRYWLRLWRQYTKDPTVESFKPLDCTCLLCSAHGNLIVPPHVDEYIKGIRKTLLTNLGDYPGDLYEIVTCEEFDILRSIWEGPIASTADFSVRFFNDESGKIEWNIERCHKCDPFDYHRNHSTNEIKRQSSGDGNVKKHKDKNIRNNFLRHVDMDSDFYAY